MSVTKELPAVLQHPVVVPTQMTADAPSAPAAAPGAALAGLIWTLVRTDFKARYHGTLSGFVWALLKPLTMFAVLTAVFSLIFGSDRTYRLDLIVGLFLWDFFAEGTKTGLTALHAKGFLLTKARFPSWILVVTSISNALITITVFGVVLCVFLALLGRAPSPLAVALFAGYLVVFTVIIVGFALGASVLFLRYRDLNQVWEVVTQAGFFVAPIIYPLSVIPEQYHFWLYAWPPTAIIEFSRAVLIDGRAPTVVAHGYLATMAVGVLLLGAWIYRRLGPRAAELPVTMGAPLLEAVGVSKTFEIPSVQRDTVREHFFGLFEPRRIDRLRVLDDVSLELHRGETLGIMGRNGSGKSTLLKVLCGIYAADSGRVTMRAGVTPILELGVGWNPELDAIDNVYLIGSIMGLSLSAIRASLDQILAFAELERFAKLPLKHYSSGMASRLAYAVAFRAVREVLVLDEIFAVGDAGFRARCEDRYRELRAAGHSMVLVSHNPGIISTFCDRAILLENGHVVVDGSAQEVASQYLSRLLTHGAETHPEPVAL